MALRAHLQQIGDVEKGAPDLAMEMAQHHALAAAAFAESAQMELTFRPCDSADRACA
jgi:hypothetical protein